MTIFDGMKLILQIQTIPVWYEKDLRSYLNIFNADLNDDFQKERSN
jgi:hypothetical protein